MGLKPIDPRAEMIKRQVRRARDQKAGVAVKHRDFLYKEEVTPEEKKRYHAAKKMGDTEYKLQKKYSNSVRKVKTN